MRDLIRHGLSTDHMATYQVTDEEMTWRICSTDRARHSHIITPAHISLVHAVKSLAFRRTSHFIDHYRSILDSNQLAT